MMKRNIIYVAISLLFLFSAPVSHAVSINVDQIIWQPDPGLDPLSLSAQVDFTALDGDSFTITLTNTSALSSPDDFPATVLLTGIGFNLPDGYSILGGGVASTNATNFDGTTASQFWGYDNNPLNSGPFLNVATLPVSTAVSTLEAAVEAGGAFAGGGIIDGPKHGVMSANYAHGSYPYFDEYALITIDLNQDVGSGNWGGFFSEIDSKDTVVSFGSPTAPVPEPATMLLLGCGLIGLAGFRRKFRKR